MFVCKWCCHLLLLLRRKWTSYQDTDTWTNILSWRSSSKMIYHLTILEENSKVIIRTSDTYVLVIALCCLEHIPESINLWLEVGLYAKNSLRYIDVRKLFNKLWKDLCRALPAFHVFTGSDYTAAFSRKRKICPVKTLRKDKTAQTVFGDMWFSDDIQEEEFKVIEKFTCTLYGKTKFNSVNEVRQELFLKKYQPKKKEENGNQLHKKDGRQFFTSLCISFTTKDE